MIWRFWHPKLIQLLGVVALTLVAGHFLLGLDIWKANSKGGLFANIGDLPGLVATGAILLLGGLSTLWAVMNFLMDSLVIGTPSAKNNYSLGSIDPLERFRRHFADTITRLKRPVLVVVDDIDRCDPAFVVELLRGMQTILKSPRVVFLLLGDRDWIEQAFAETHKSMKDIDVGPEHSFGGRFVEKSIQISMVLPDVLPDQRQTFVRKTLGMEDRAETPSQAQTKEVDDIRDEVRSIVTEAANPIERDRRAASLQKRIDRSDTFQDEEKRVISREINCQVAMRASTDEKTQAAVRHRLEPVAPLLPPNPRQIKRIINAIAFNQEVARLVLNLEPETKRWRQLALWIVLMIEWPQTWRTLAQWPGLLSHLHSTTADPVEGLDSDTADHWVRAIKENGAVTGLLNFPAQPSVPDDWKDSRLDEDAIVHLNQILPPTSGSYLPEPKPQPEEQP